MKRFVLVLFLAVGSLANLSAQSEHKPEIQYWAFMVRNTARLQEIAYRFQVTEADIKKQSDIKGKTVYPGKVIVIPVKVRPATWDPTKFNPNKPFLSNEDARPQLDFEWDNNALDPLLKDDYILLSEIQGDSVQTERMTKHIGKIDKRVVFLNHQIDSIKNTEFAFQYDEKDMNAVLKKMEKARLRYYAQSPLGKEVDSLNEVKIKLNEEINRLRNKLSEYDYLTENAYYFEKNREGESDMLERINNRPGEQLVAESNYIKKADDDLKVKKKKKRHTKKKGRNTEPIPIETEQLLVKDIVPTETSATNKLNSDTTSANTTKINKTQPASKSEPIQTEQSNTVRSNDIKETITPAVVKEAPKTPAIEQNKTTDNRVAEPLKDEKLLSTKLSLNSTQTDAANTATQNKPAPAAVTETQQVKTIKQQAKEEPKIESVVEEVTPQQKPANISRERNNNTSVQIPIQSTLKPLTERDLSMKEEIKKAIANKIIPKEVDPLDEYSESPDFAFKGLNFQTISVSKGKNGPKYLTPVDAITSLKAKIWIEKFKDEMKIKDFKKAESYLRKAIETNANSAETWTYHAEMLSAAGNAPDALKEYFVATTIDPTFARPYFKMALLYDKSNNIEKAYEFFGLSIEADSSFYKAYLSRANLSLRLGDLKAAIEDYSSLLEVNKNFSLAYKERGSLRMMDRDYAGAVEDFNAYLDIEDPSGEVLYKRGVAKVYTGKIIEGCNDFNLSLQLNYTDAAKAIKKYCE